MLDFIGLTIIVLTTYGLKAYGIEMSTPSILRNDYNTLYFDLLNNH